MCLDGSERLSVRDVISSSRSMISVAGLPMAVANTIRMYRSFYI